MPQITEQDKHQSSWVILSAIANARLFECAISGMIANPHIRIAGAERLTINALKKQIDSFIFRYKEIDDILLQESVGLLSTLEQVTELLSTPQKATDFATFVAAYYAGEVVVNDAWIAYPKERPEIGCNVCFKTAKTTMVGKYTKDGFKALNGKIIADVVGYVVLPE